MRKASLFISTLFLALILTFATVLPVLATSLPEQDNVPIGKVWQVKFSQAVDSSTVQDNIVVNLLTGSSFSIQPSIDPSDSTVVLVKHALPFASGTSYKLSINPGLKSLSGNSLADSTSMVFSTTANTAVTENNYVALGDSIACGVSSSPGNDYVDLFYNYLKNQSQNAGTGMILNNVAVSGYTSSDLLTQLQDSKVQKTLQTAKVITLSIGSNNLLKPTISAVAAAFNLNPQDANFTTEVANKLADPSSSATLLNLMSPDNLPKALNAGVTQFAADWSSIVSTIKSLNPNAQVYVTTLYNPLSKDSAVNQLIFDEYDPYIQAINTIIMNADNRYKVADVYPLFLNNQGDPVTDMSLLDPHPTDKGYKLIYQALLNAMTNS